MSTVKTDAMSRRSHAKRAWNSLLVACVAIPTLLSSNAAQAAGVINLGNGESISMGLGMRASYAD